MCVVETTNNNKTFLHDVIELQVVFNLYLLIKSFISDEMTIYIFSEFHFDVT